MVCTLGSHFLFLSSTEFCQLRYGHVLFLTYRNQVLRSFGEKEAPLIVLRPGTSVNFTRLTEVVTDIWWGEEQGSFEVVGGLMLPPKYAGRIKVPPVSSIGFFRFEIEDQDTLLKLFYLLKRSIDEILSQRPVRPEDIVDLGVNESRRQRIVRTADLVT